IHDFSQMSVKRALAFLDELGLTETEQLIGHRIVKEIRERLTFLDDVGVGYLLDEPSIGLHQRDNARLIATLERLRDIGNTVVVVEHDEEMMRRSDWVIDMG